MESAHLLILFLFLGLFAGISEANYPCAATGSTANILCSQIFVSNATLDVGQSSTIAVIGVNSASGLQLTANILFQSANIPATNTIAFTVNELSLPTANTISFGINAIAANQLILTANVPGTMVQLLIANSISSSTTNTITGQWVFNVFVTDGAGNTIETSNIIHIGINPPVELSFNTLPSFPLVQSGNTVTVNDIASGGSGAFTYNWFVGNVVGGYDLLQFSLVPPFAMPPPPPPNVLAVPPPMFLYQNPGNTVSVSQYVWNGMAFNSVSASNSLAVPAGNEAALPVLVPNLFTVSSSLTNAFLFNLPPGSLPPEFQHPSTVMYDLDAYSLVQSSTFNNFTSSNSPQPMNTLTAGVNVVLTNLGVSTKYISQNTPPLGILIKGHGTGKGRTTRKSLVLTFNSLPPSGGTLSNYAHVSLFDNITNVTILGPQVPANGVMFRIYDSANTATPVTDTANNLLIATFTYNGPVLLYNVTGSGYLGASQLASNTVQYLGENSFPVNFILTQNTLVGTPPAAQVPYFTYNLPEISTGSGSPDSFVNIEIENTSFRPGTFPTYSISNPPQQVGQPPSLSIVYYNPTHAAVGEKLLNVTARGSVFGPPNPTGGFVYFMATNAITYVQGAQTPVNVIAPASAAFASPTVLKAETIDAGVTTPVTINSLVVIGSYPPIQPASVTLTNSSLSVGQTTFATIHLSGGQPPYTGSWDMFPPGVATTQNDLMPLMLPTNEITLLINVTSSNTLTLTPTLGINETNGGGRNNTMLLSISDNEAFLTLPNLAGGPQTTELMATGLSSNTVYGLWSGNSVVNGADPQISFTILAPSQPSGGGGPPPSVTLEDNVATATNSSVPVFTAYLVDQQGLVSTSSFYQNQLPAAPTLGNSGEHLNITFPCSFSSGGTLYEFSGTAYGIGAGIRCGANYTEYGGTIETLYKPSAATTTAQTTLPGTTVAATTAPTTFHTTVTSTTSTYPAQTTELTTVGRQQSTQPPGASAATTLLAAAVAMAIVAVIARYYFRRKAAHKQ